MAKVYLSYNRRDRTFVTALARALVERGHEVTADIDTITAGQDWRRTLQDALRRSEVSVIVISENSMQSQFFLSEVGAARAYAESGGSMLVIPVVLDGAQIPPVLSDIQCVVAGSADLPHIIDEIDKSIAALVGRKAAQEAAQEKVSERIETNAAAFVDDAVRSLNRFELRNRLFGVCWYCLGFSALLGGLAIAYFRLKGPMDPKTLGWPELAFITVKTVMTIALLGAAAKYAFSLGKSYTSESLKAADRLHAISFGRFYLRVFGAKATWTELKDAFQHWNIDRRSSFAELDVSQIDPRIMEAIIEIAKSVTGSEKKKKKDA